MSEQGSPTGAFRHFTFRATSTSGERMKKHSQVDILLQNQVALSYEIDCDESEILGGDNSAPPPLAFFTASVAFCLMTQISRYAVMRKVQVDKVEMTTTIKFHNEGSVLKGDIHGVVDSVESNIEIQSPEDEATVAKLLADAEQGCYVQQALVNPTTVTNTLIHTH